MKKINLYLLALLLCSFIACRPTKNLISAEAENEKIYQDYIKQMSEKYKQKAAPDIDISLLDGKNIKLSDYLGKTVLLNFWFINCPPCLTEIASLNELQRSYKNKDVVVISIALDDTERLKYVTEAKGVE